MSAFGHLLCSVRGHRRTAEKRWDGEFHHSSCSRCGAAIVRLSGEGWRLPSVDEQRYFERMAEVAESPQA